MVKKKELVKELVPEVTGVIEETLMSNPDRTPVVELNDLAFSLVKDEKTGRYHVATIKFDFGTRTIGDLEVLPESNDSKTIVFEDYFKKAISYHVWR